MLFSNSSSLVHTRNGCVQNLSTTSFAVTTNYPLFSSFRYWIDSEWLTQLSWAADVSDFNFDNGIYQKTATITVYGGIRDQISAFLSNVPRSKISDLDYVFGSSIASKF